MRYKLLIAMAALGLVATPALATDPIQGLVNTCNNCHGTGGVSVGHSMPSIAGLSETYLKNILMEWKSGARAFANMTRLISGYTDAEIAALAKYYAKLPWTPVVQPVAADLIAKGKDITDRCETCHGVTGGKPDDEETPRLNGQWAKYLELEMLKYRDPGFQMTHKKMIKNTQKLEQGDVATAAQYYGAQSK
ncbi:MAG: hypothetical protein KKG92_00800 [Gammaproteobacteria bacterium]|nr:hypothetical protein [Gammaproteobacteria bacterium]